MTIGVFPVLIALTSGQVLLALTLALGIGGFYRSFRRAYLRRWLYSWLALVVFLGGSALSARPGGVAAHDLRSLAFGVAVLAGYLHVAWLLLGVFELAREREASRATIAAALAGAVLVALASVGAALVGVGAQSALSVRSAVAGAGYVAAAALILLSRRAATMGRGFATFALLLYAADQFAYFALRFHPPIRQVRTLPLLMSFDLVATSVLGLALVTWLLEGERERLLRAGELERRRERAQAGIFGISEATRTTRNLPRLFRSVHEILRDVLPAGNFQVALLDRSSGRLSFPYFVDERDRVPEPRPLARGLAEYVLRTGQPLLATRELIEDLGARGELDVAACGCAAWLGAPLVVRGEAIGVAAIRSYDPATRFGPDERDLLAFASEQIAAAVEAKRAEDALRESEARLRLALEQVPAILWATDDQLCCTTVAGAGLALLGVQPERAVGMSVAEYLGGGDATLASHRRALAGESTRYEQLLGDRSLLVHLEPLRDESGAIAGTVGIALDLTEKRRADRAWRESEARLRQVIDLVPHFIFALDEDGRFLLANRAVAEAHGTTVDAMVGRTCAELVGSGVQARLFHEDDLEVIRTGRRKVVPEHTMVDAGGRLRYLHTTKIPFAFSGTGRPAILGVSIDVSERRAAEEALRRAAKDESLTVLAGGVAHDFNNLLAAVLGHASLALRDLPEGSATRRHVEKAAAVVERASDLTRQMLAYSGRGHFVVRPTDFNRVIQENLPLLEVAVPKNVRLDAQLHPRLPAVDADVGQIQQILMNLVINAAEAIGGRGGTVTVATGVRELGPADSPLWRASGQPLPPGSYVMLEVRDDGPGMDARTSDRIFEPFFTTKGTGRGLGLAAVLGVVRGHRGALSVDSAPGRGTVFRLLFARSAAEAGQAAAGGPSPGPRDRLRLLLIDDEDVVREMVSEVLEHEGVEVLCAGNGLDGVRLFEQRAREIDVVLLDLSMPGIGGEETYARLHRIDPDIVVILSSGYDHDEAMQRFGAKGPAGFIQKPYRPQQLMAEIDRCLGRVPAAPPAPSGRG